MDVVDTTDYLTDLLLISVLALDLILEVKFKSLVLHLNILDLTLECSHMALLSVQLGVHLLKSLLLLFLDSFHRCINV